ncbi:hypothetical protein [Nostoc punctiforme]|uniref:hypothetical protein n=1 Tax=Nostoc punctiforme TaxID=272131 RepID=UPI001F54F6A1|nr:hypothetical protein [Nostoc punctiforme]
MTEALGGCAKHGNVKAEALARKAEALTGCAKHGNVKAEALARKAEALAGCAKHGNVKAEALARKTEALTGKAEALTVAISCCNIFLMELPNKKILLFAVNNIASSPLVVA